MILETISEKLVWVLFVVLALNLSQRKIPHTQKKRLALIYLAMLVIGLQFGVALILTREANQLLVLPLAAVLAAIGIIKRDKVWPFRLHCSKCHGKMGWNHVIGYDDNLCEKCWEEAHPKEKKETQPETETESRAGLSALEKVEQVDWDSWDPTDICVITFLVDGDSILLIEKKQGMGTGKINVPGGHIEPDELAVDAAVREFKEESGLDISGLTPMGTLHFQFRDGIAEKGYIFTAENWEGELAECDETRPFWHPVKKMPYDQMWADDRLWVPALLEGKKINGYFLFDGDTMLDYKLTTDE